ncbi:unnamed protein product [Laminaria digitata]
MLSPAAVLDACALYGRSNPSLVADLLRSLGELDGGAVGVILAEGLEEAGLTAARALAEVHAKVAGAHDGVGGPSMGRAEASDVLSYIVDVAVSTGSLLQAASQCSTAPNGSSGNSGRGGTTRGGGGGGRGAGRKGEVFQLAFRLQGTDGGVSPEGLAAALALAYEATLPALEGLLDASATGLVGRPSEVNSVKARGRLARQWLLRCLHWLLGPVFLRPLGLQEASASFSAGTGDGDGQGVAAAVAGSVAGGGSG